jgi:hypothetical protein
MLRGNGSEFSLVVFKQFFSFVVILTHLSSECKHPQYIDRLPCHFVSTPALYLAYLFLIHSLRLAIITELLSPSPSTYMLICSMSLFSVILAFDGL